MGKKLPWYQKDTIGIAHEDERRSLTVILNADFVARQVKILHIKKDSVLGNHYHRYRELFYILQGRAVFYLERVPKRGTAVVNMEVGDRLVLHSGVAHRVKMFEGTITVEATESTYVSPEANDIPYEVHLTE